MRKAFYTAIGTTLLGSAVLMAAPAWADNTVTGTASTSAPTATTTAPVANTAKGERGPGPLIIKLTNKLNLTQQQKDQIRIIVQNARPKMADLMNQDYTSEKALRAAMESDQYDATQIKQLATQKGNITAQLIEARADMHHQVMLVLMPAQKTQLRQLMQQERTKWKAQHNIKEDNNG